MDRGEGIPWRAWLVEERPGDSARGTGTSWHYVLVSAGKCFSLHIIHHRGPEDTYRLHVYYWRSMKLSESNQELLWGPTDASFGRAHHALDMAITVVRRFMLAGDQ